ncbi:MAG: hypothetical protein KGS60_01770 [Verrucomicrobia bacterium]|nr:hypothetical protein [Verrucomicrobiota bacterium]
MGEELTLQPGKIPDLPSDWADPMPLPPPAWLALRPDLFGLPGWAVVAIYLAEVLLLILLLRWLGALILKARPRPAAASLPPPADEARAMLAKLKSSPDLPLRDLAILLGSTVRRFAERKYGIGLTTRTQEEFRALLVAFPDALPAGFASGLDAFLQACDQAKFQPGTRHGEFKEQLWNQASLLVQKAPEPVKPDESP